MRTLTLIRHAKSSWAYPELSDFERPLNERGRSDAPRMAERAGRELPAISRLISSPATRAITTARVFAPLLDVGMDAIRLDSRLYNASRVALLELLQGLESSVSHVVLVGHNPGFSELAHTLADCPFDEMPTSAVVQLQLKIKQWADVGPNCAEMQRYLFPKDGLA